MTSLRDEILQSLDIRSVVAQAVRAPSVHNTQPWRFRWDGLRLKVLADSTRGLTVNDPDGRELVISCGAALFNVRLALRKLGMQGTVSLLPRGEDAHTLAVVEIAPGAPPDADERRLFAAMARRHTHRGAFDPQPVSADLAVRLQQAAESEGVHLIYVNDPGQRARILHLSRAAERLLAGDDEARAEIERWTPAPSSTRRDGIPAWAYSRELRNDDTDDLAYRDFDLQRGFGALPPVEHGGGAVAVLATDRDIATSWLAAGQALEHVLVVAAERSAYAAIHSQVTEVPHLRAEVQRELCTAAQPQLLLRIGYGTADRPTPRRAVDDVLEIILH